MKANLNDLNYVPLDLTLRKFSKETSTLAYKWIKRRSQKKSFTYAQYCKFKKYNPLPEPKIYHLTYTLSSY